MCKLSEEQNVNLLHVNTAQDRPEDAQPTKVVYVNSYLAI